MSDLYLIPTSDGSEISVTDGKPRMTSGLETAVYLSLFTESYWGNTISDIPERYASRVPVLMNRPLTNQTRLAMIDAAKNALQWMIDERVADTITVEAEIAAVGQLNIRVQINEPENQEAFAYGINWDAQEASLL